MPCRRELRKVRMPMPPASGRSPPTRTSLRSGKTPIPTFPSTSKPRQSTRSCNSSLLPVWRIAVEDVGRDLTRVSVAGVDNRDILGSLDSDALVIRHGSGQRTDFIALVVDDIHA